MFLEASVAMGRKAWRVMVGSMEQPASPGRDLLMAGEVLMVQREWVSMVNHSLCVAPAIAHSLLFLPVLACWWPIVVWESEKPAGTARFWADMLGLRSEEANGSLAVASWSPSAMFMLT